MAEAANDDAEVLSKDLKSAAYRVNAEESLKFLSVHKKFKDLIDQEASLKSFKILAKRELYEIINRKDQELDEEELQEEKTRLREERDQLHKVLIKHKTLADSMQEAAFQNQMQNAVFENLSPNATVSSKFRSTVQRYNENLSCSSELSEVISVTEASERKLLSLRVKYRTLLQSIENKWKILAEMTPDKSKRQEQTKNPEIKSFIEKLTRRQERLNLLVCILQCLISSSGEKWGSNERILELMLLCDKAQTFLGGYEDVGEDVQALKLAREKDLQEKEGRKMTRLEKFISSTPR